MDTHTQTAPATSNAPTDRRSEYLREARRLDGEREKAALAKIQGWKKERRAETVTRIGVEDLTRRGVQVISPIESEEIARSEQDDLIRRLRQACGVASKFAGAKLSDALPEQREAAKILAGILEPSCTPRILIVAGDVGTGKSHLLSGLVLELVRRGQYAMYTDTRALIDLARDAVCGRASESWRTIIARYIRARLVVFDEASAAVGTTFSVERLEQVIDERYRAGRDTILAGNAEPERFEAVIGARVVSRAREAGGVLIMRGEDLRGRLAGVGGIGSPH
jgi:DNA replication protein DnaC